MELNPFPRLANDLADFYSANQWPLLVLCFCGAGLLVHWHTHWKTKYKRIMKTTFHHCGLFVNTKKGNRTTPLYPLFIAFDETDEEYMIMKYHLRPGMSLTQFEDRKKHFEAAFNTKVIIYGKGKHVIFKIRKIPYDEPGVDQEL